jgi:hypothetical protein
MSTSDHAFRRPSAGRRTTAIGLSSSPLSPKQISNRDQQKKRNPLHNVSSASAARRCVTAAKYSGYSAPQCWCIPQGDAAEVSAHQQFNACFSHWCHGRGELRTSTRSTHGSRLAADLRTFGFSMGDADSRKPAKPQEAGVMRPMARSYFDLFGKRQLLVGVRGFEPPTPASRTQYSTRLSYTPKRP